MARCVNHLKLLIAELEYFAVSQLASNRAARKLRRLVSIECRDSRAVLNRRRVGFMENDLRAQIVELPVCQRMVRMAVGVDHQTNVLSARQSIPSGKGAD